MSILNLFTRRSWVVSFELLPLCPQWKVSDSNWIVGLLGPRNGMNVVKLSLCLTKHHAMKTYTGSGGIAPRILDLGTRWRGMVSFTPRPLYPQGKNSRYPLDRRLSGPQSRSGRGGEEKNSHPRHRKSNPRTPINVVSNRIFPESAGNRTSVLQYVASRFSEWISWHTLTLKSIMKTVLQNPYPLYIIFHGSKALRTNSSSASW
jgi:hypothetical protein